MRIGVMADTHDRIPAIRELLKQMQAGGVGLVMHAGDFCAPFALAPVAEANVALLGVFGHNDGDRGALKAAAQQAMGIELHESPHSLEVGGKRILLVHDIGEVVPRSLEEHEIVIHGHTHRTEAKTRGNTLLLNPGEACGWLHGSPTAAILDLDTKAVEVLKLTGPEWQF